MQSTAKPVWLMPFGKHRGKPVGEVPTDYMLWFLEEVAGRDEIKARYQNEVARRKLAAQKAKQPANTQRSLLSGARVTEGPKRSTTVTVRGPGYTIEYDGEPEVSRLRKIIGNTRGGHPAWPGVDVGDPDEECPFEAAEPVTSLDQEYRAIVG